MRCPDKIRYQTAWEAEQARRNVVARIGKKDKRLKRLVVYHCPDCRGYHLGHQGQFVNKSAPEPKPPKLPTPGQARRKEQREQRSINRRARHALGQMGYLADVTEAAKIAKQSVDDLADSLIHARRLAERYQFVK